MIFFCIVFLSGSGMGYVCWPGCELFSDVLLGILLDEDAIRRDYCWWWARWC